MRSFRRRGIVPDHVQFLTEVLLDGAVLLNTTQLRTPSGTFVGTVDPFLLDGIVFAAGGFGILSAANRGSSSSRIASVYTPAAKIMADFLTSSSMILS